MVEYVRFSRRPDKLAEAVIYLAERSAGDPNFGETKLVKLLYFADCAAYFRRGTPITGTTYVHLPHGPYPDNWQGTKADLINRGEVREIRTEARGGYRQHQLAANRPAQSEILTAEERACLDDQLRQFAGYNGAEIEEYSHRVLGWQTTETGEVIPYELSMLSVPKLTDEVRERGRRIVADFIKWRESVQSG